MIVKVKEDRSMENKSLDEKSALRTTSSTSVKVITTKHRLELTL